jgi:predicted flavoprotein YhiN
MIGGIRTDEIDPHTMQSYVAPGLYFAGEMVDVHADLGGYNFQWAWSSGVIAGRHAAAR